MSEWPLGTGSVVSTGSTIRAGGLDGLDHPGWWSRRARPPGLVVSTGSTTRESRRAPPAGNRDNLPRASRVFYLVQQPPGTNEESDARKPRRQLRRVRDREP